jgi:hypothetical protein
MLRALGHQAAGQAKAPDMTDEAIWPGLIAAIITALVSLILFLLLASAPAKAATITAKGNVIEIKGDIELGDSDKFSAKLGAFPDTKIVSLNSRGGRARDAYRIGVLLRIWEMGTIVPEGQTCQSACVVIWAAGIWRELAPGASLYMHCHFRVEGLNKVKDLSKIDLKTVKCSDVANENLARYYKHFGMPQEAIDILSKSKPTNRMLVRRNMDGLIKPHPAPVEISKPKRLGV